MRLIRKLKFTTRCTRSPYDNIRKPSLGVVPTTLAAFRPLAIQLNFDTNSWYTNLNCVLSIASSSPFVLFKKHYCSDTQTDAVTNSFFHSPGSDRACLSTASMHNVISLPWLRCFQTSNLLSDISYNMSSDLLYTICVPIVWKHFTAAAGLGLVNDDVVNVDDGRRCARLSSTAYEMTSRWRQHLDDVSMTSTQKVPRLAALCRDWPIIMI